MADNNQDKATVNDSDINVDPIVQGVDRVQARQEADARLDASLDEGTQDTQTRANIHLGSRDAKGEGFTDNDDVIYPSASVENTIVNGSPVHTNIDLANIELAEAKLSELRTDTGLSGDEDSFGTPITTAGTATSEIEFDAVSPTEIKQQSADAKAATSVEAVQFSQNQVRLEPQDATEDVIDDDTSNSDINITPVANEDSGALDENETFTLNVIANDTDTDNDSLFITDVTLDGGLGAVSHDGTNITFNPGSAFDHLDEGETESVTITYAISDGEGGSDTAILTLTITGSNDGPIIGNVDLGATLEDTAVTFTAADLLANSSDVDGDALTVTSVSVEATFGTITENADGSYSFTPTADYNGDDVPLSFTVTDGTTSASATATLDVTAVNDGPVAGDDSFSGTEDQDISGSVLANDTDVDGDSHSVVAETLSTARGGTVDISADGSFIYTPAADFTGTDSFSYTLSDGTTTDTGTVSLEVGAVNDGPIIGNVDLGATLEDTVVTFTAADLLANSSDVDGDALTVTSVSVEASFGTITENADGSYSFTPTADYNGDDVPLSFTVTDGTTSASATATLDVTAVNDGPVAGDDTATTGEDTSVTLNVLGNDTDIEGDSLTVTSATVTSGAGNVTINTDGSLNYDPGAAYNSLSAGETASVEIRYDISDGQGGTDSAIVTVTVTGSNDGPIVGDVDLGATTEDTVISFSVADLLANSTDVDGDELSVSNVTVDAEFGTVSNNGDGTYNFMPTADYNGNGIPLNFTVNDGTISSSATAIIDVTAVADSPEISLLVGDVITDTTGGSHTYPITITTGLTDTYGSEVLSSVTLGWVPDGAILSAGSDNGDGTWTLTQDDLNGLTITVPEGQVDFSLTASVTSTELSNEDAKTSIAAVTVDTPNSGEDNANETGNGNGNNNVHGNNGFGNGDQDAPGNSLEHNNAENAQTTNDTSPEIPTNSNLITDGDGNSTIQTTNKADFVDAGSGDDTILASNGDDVLFGNSGNDTISGGNQDDQLFGGSGNDQLFGGAGNDILVGGSGDDVMDGGKHNDTFIFGANEGNDTVSGGNGQAWTDAIQLSGFTNSDSQQGWTLTLDNGSTILSTDEVADEILLSDDASGTITFDDGGTIEFDGIEKIFW